MNDVHTAANTLTNHLVFLFNKHFPLRVVRVRSDDKPWVKPSLKLLINKRDEAFSKGKRWKYLRLRAAVIQHCAKLKNNFLMSAINSKNPSLLWKTIKKLVCQDSSVCVRPDANRLKDIFSSVFNDCIVPLNDFSDMPSQPLCISIDEVIFSLKSLKNSSPGSDGLPPWLFCDNRSLLAPVICHIFNLSVSCGIVPDIFKEAFVVPVPKTKNPSCDDFRPISMLPVLSKLLEKIVFRKWLFPLVPKIHKNQFAFVPRDGQGTTVALTYIMNRTLSFLDTPGAVRLLMIDFCKAFDKLPHNSILNALSSLKAPRELLSWLCSFFYQRRQCVKVNNVLSDWYFAPSGVPQGGVLSPLLFALTVNNLDVSFENSTLVKYADDFCLLHFLRHKDDDHLQEEFDNIRSKSMDLGLSINQKKTKLLNFQTKMCIPSPVLTVGSFVIEIVPSTKLLGLTLSSDFSWRLHVSEILSKSRKRLFFLHRLKQAKAPECVLWKTYCAMIRSIMCYSYPAWCNISKCDMQRLKQFEHRICKRFHIKCGVAFSDFCFSLAERLAASAIRSHHPLNGIFDILPSRFSARLGKSHRKVLARTSRFKNSFISFA
jgi:hypothetical protein